MKLVIFDIDGTLTSTCGVDNEFLARVISKFVGVPDIDTNWENYPSFTDTGVAEHCLMNHRNRLLTKDEAEQIENEFMVLLRGVPPNSFEPIQGAREFFQALRESDSHEVAIATGSWRLSAVHKLAAAGIPYDGVPIASSNDSNTRENIMRKAEERAFAQYGNSEFDETIYIGDGEWDVRATNALKWRMVGMGANYERLRTLGVEHVFEDYTCAKKILTAIDA